MLAVLRGVVQDQVQSPGNAVYGTTFVLRWCGSIPSSTKMNLAKWIAIVTLEMNHHTRAGQ